MSSCYRLTGHEYDAFGYCKICYRPHPDREKDYPGQEVIKNALDQQRQEIIEELEGMREKAKDSRRGNVDLDDLYEGALTDAISKIKEMK